MSDMVLPRGYRALLLATCVALVSTPSAAQLRRPTGLPSQSVAMQPSVKLTAFGAPDFVATNPTQVGHYEWHDSALVCGKFPTLSPANPFGTGYAFSRLTAYPGQAAGSYNLNNFYRVVKYQTTASGVSSSLIGAPSANANLHALPRNYLNMTVVGGDPYNGTSPAERDKTYMFGGYLANSFSNEYFSYSESEGFKLPNTPHPSLQVPTAPTTNLLDKMLPSGRAAMAGVSIGNNKILLVGGYNASGVSSEIYLFDRSLKTWAQKASLPVALKGVRLLAAGGNGNVSFVYLVGGSQYSGGSADNRKIYRYDVALDKWIVLQDSSGVGITIPGTSRVEIASVLGQMTVLTQSDDQIAMIAHRFTHPTPALVDLAAGTGKGSVLSSIRFDKPVRARGGFGLLRCSPDAWAIGGTFGHGPSFSDRSKMVDKLTM